MSFLKKKNLKHNFSLQTRLAGKDWLYGFFKRNPSVSIKKPESTSLARITGFNREEVMLFFQNLEYLMTQHKFKATKIYNMDETGISTVQDPGLIIAEKGQKSIGSVTSWEWGKNVTVICSMSASGNYIPPLFIFPRKRMSNSLSKGGPPGALYHVTDNGWTNDEIFLIWLKHFTAHVKPNNEEPVLLILDNHGSHITLPAYNFCRTNGIIMLSIPPHSSHRMQPLDVKFFGPLKKAFKKECDLFIKSQALIKITPYDLAEIFNKAYSSIATIRS